MGNPNRTVDTPLTKNFSTGIGGGGFFLKWCVHRTSMSILCISTFRQTFWSNAYTWAWCHPFRLAEYIRLDDTMLLYCSCRKKNWYTVMGISVHFIISFLKIWNLILKIKHKALITCFSEIGHFAHIQLWHQLAGCATQNFSLFLYPLIMQLLFSFLPPWLSFNPIFLLYRYNLFSSSIHPPPRVLYLTSCYYCYWGW